MQFSETDKSFIKKILPEKFLCVPIQFKKQAAEKHDFGYQLTISSEAIGSVEELNEFIHEFGCKNEARYTLTNSSKKDAFYRGWYRCQHYHKFNVNSASRIKARKGTECESKISAVIRVLKKDPTKKTTKVVITFVHNHSLTSGVALRYRIPSSDVQEKFKNLFESRRMGPAEALRAYRKHVEQQSSLNNEVQHQVSNRGIIPDYDWVRHFYTKGKYGMERDAIELDAPNTSVSFTDLPDDDDVHSVQITHDENDLPAVVDEREMEEEIKKFEELTKLCVEKIRNNPVYYLDGLKSMNKNLKSALNSCPANFLKMLYSLNRSAEFTPKRRMRSTKRIGVNAAAVNRCRRPVARSAGTDQ